MSNEQVLHLKIIFLCLAFFLQSASCSILIAAFCVKAEAGIVLSSSAVNELTLLLLPDVLVYYCKWLIRNIFITNFIFRYYNRTDNAGDNFATVSDKVIGRK